MDAASAGGEDGAVIRVFGVFGSVISVFVLAACASEPRDGGADADAVAADAGEDAGPRLTYFRDVKPIVDAKCVACHEPGGIGPIDFSVADTVVQLAPLIRGQLEADLMPPWPPGQDCRPLRHNRSLSADHKQTILDWIDLGAPLGDPATEGRPLPSDLGGLTRIDHTLRVPEAYAPAAGDDYHCFVIDWPDRGLRYITGFNVVPTLPSIVHHVNIYSVNPANADRMRTRDQNAVGPGYPCFGGAATENGIALLGAWAPGSLGTEYPAGTGLGVEEGSVVVLEVHYSAPAAEGLADQLALELQMEDQVDRRGVIIAFWDFMNWSMMRNMDIPANEPDVMHSVEVDPNGAFRFFAPWIEKSELLVHGVGIHMHYLGSSASLSIRHTGGGEDCVLSIPRWDFHWQSGYLLEEPIEFLVGLDRVYLECHWDNTAENQPVIGGERRPARDVNWGASSADEMCIGYAYIVEA